MNAPIVRQAMTMTSDFASYVELKGLQYQPTQIEIKQSAKKKLEKINSSIAFLDSIIDSASYSKQECSLKQELIKFLMQINTQKPIVNALPEDLKIIFLLALR